MNTKRCTVFVQALYYVHGAEHNQRNEVNSYSSDKQCVLMSTTIQIHPYRRNFGILIRFPKLIQERYNRTVHIISFDFSRECEIAVCSVFGVLSAVSLISCIWKQHFPAGRWASGLDTGGVGLLHESRQKHLGEMHIKLLYFSSSNVH